MMHEKSYLSIGFTHDSSSHIVIEVRNDDMNIALPYLFKHLQGRKKN